MKSIHRNGSANGSTKGTARRLPTCPAPSPDRSAEARPGDQVHEAQAHEAQAREMLLPIGSVHPSPHNPRKHFDPAELGELAATIRTRGLLYPVIVWEPKAGWFEILDGERRWRAAQMAELQIIPAKVLDVDARQARELALIANVQRRNLSTLELAHGCALLCEEHGYSADTLAARIGKSQSTVRDLIKIARQLPPLACEALEAGRIPVSTAALIARVPSESAREELARTVVAGSAAEADEAEADDADDADDAEAGDQAGQGDADGEQQRPPLSYVETKHLLKERFMRQLKQAPFALDDAELVPAAGSCTACPKRTGNNREDYPSSRGDICTEPACFAAKVEAHAQRQAAQQPPAAASADAKGPAAGTRGGKGKRQQGTDWLYEAGMAAGDRWADEVASAEDLDQLEAARRELPLNGPAWLWGFIHGALATLE